MPEGFDPPRFISRLHGRARHSCWTRRSHGWRNIPAGGAVRALARVCTHTVQCRQGEALQIKMGTFPRAAWDIYKSNCKCSLPKHGRQQSCRHTTTPSCSTLTCLRPPSQFLAISCPNTPSSPGSNIALGNASTVWDPAPSFSFRSQELPLPPAMTHLCTLQVGI